MNELIREQVRLRHCLLVPQTSPAFPVDDKDIIAECASGHSSRTVVLRYLTAMNEVGIAQKYMGPEEYAQFLQEQMEYAADLFHMVEEERTGQ